MSRLRLHYLLRLTRTSHSHFGSHARQSPPSALGARQAPTVAYVRRCCRQNCALAPLWTPDKLPSWCTGHTTRSVGITRGHVCVRVLPIPRRCLRSQS